MPVLRIRAPGPEGRRPRADHRAARRRHDHRGRRRPRRRPSTCTPDRSRASSTTRSTTSPRCPCSRSTCAQALDGEIVFVAPDAGGGKLARRFADRFSADIAFIDKRRPKGTHNVAVATEVVGEIDGRTCVIVDDMIDTAGTVVSAANLLIDRGASEVLHRGDPRSALGPGRRPAEERADPGGRRHQHGADPVREALRQPAGALDRPAARRTRSTPSSRRARSASSSAATTSEPVNSPVRLCEPGGRRQLALASTKVRARHARCNADREAAPRHRIAAPPAASAARASCPPSSTASAPTRCRSPSRARELQHILTGGSRCEHGHHAPDRRRRRSSRSPGRSSATR